jgi:3'-phosphoadenosine 5'-phosphosulfate (PAPS) 3'-phosphatase
MKIDDALREGAIALAHEAADAILAVYEHAFEVEHKSDRSPLTAADLAAHRILVEGPGSADARHPRVVGGSRGRHHVEYAPRMAPPVAGRSRSTARASSSSATANSR